MPIILSNQTKKEKRFKWSRSPNSNYVLIWDRLMNKITSYKYLYDDQSSKLKQLAYYQ